MATANGVVELAGYTAGNGNHVKIKHDKTYATQYLHMSRIMVRRGQRVMQGQIIGKVGRYWFGNWTTRMLSFLEKW